MANICMKLHDFYQTHSTLKPGEVILDVRNPDEFAQGHIKNALNIPLPLLSERKSYLEKFSQIYIHCKRGGRAKNAMAVLTELGFNNLVCVDDAGMEEWENSGYPLVK
ncbi:MAG: rhodanese-like domain-containing protein [Bacteriovoracaceae bacterium]|nr:rhodanese-like domain-containing protein [Bacteriovoracaceae bacterium]